MKGNLLFICLFVTIITSIFTGVEAVPFADMRFELFNTNNGLSNNRPQCIYRDRKGYLWIGTQSGLNRFDGTNIKIFSINGIHINSLSGQTINCIFEDSNNSLWVGTNAGLNLYNPKTETFTRFEANSSTVTGLSNNMVSSIFEDKQGCLWIYTHDCLNKFIPEHKNFKHYNIPFKTNKLRENYYLDKASIDAEVNIWGVRGNVLWRFNTQTLQFNSYSDIELIGSSFSVETCVVTDSYGMVWIGTGANGLFSFNRNTLKFNQFPTTGKSFGTNSKKITDLFIDNNYLLIATEPGGLNRLDLKTKRFEYCLHSAGEANEMAVDFLLSIYKDWEGILYLGSRENGLGIYNPKKDRFKNRLNTLNNNKFADNNLIVFVFEDSQGLIWTGIQGNGISAYNPLTNKSINYLNISNNANSLSNNNVICIAEDKNADIWIGTWLGGLNKFNRKSGRFYHYMPNPNDSSSISYNKILSIKNDNNGNLLLSYFPDGIDIFNIKTGVVKKFRNIDNDKTSAPNTYVDHIVNIGNNGYGLISPNGYWTYSGTKNTFFKNKHLDGIHITDVLRDTKNNIWFATLRDGLWVIERNGKIRKYSSSNGLISNSVSAILEDNNHNIWISTDRGLCEYISKTGKFRHFDQLDGLPSNSFVVYSRLKSRDSKLHFGSHKGLVSFYPDSINVNTFTPHVYINEFQIFNLPVSLQTPNTPLKHTIEETGEIKLTYKESVFSFGFTALNFTNPQKSVYAYKMEGFDNKWNYTSHSRRYATYTNLNPGIYTFMVKASNNDGIWNETPTSIIIKITPPFYKTWWFRILITVLIIGSIVSFFFYRVTNLEKQKQVLEKKVKERTLELEEVNTQLEERQEEIIQQNYNLEIQSAKITELDMLKTRFFINISHEFRTPLTLILGPIESMLSGFRKKKLAEETSTLELVNRNARRLLNLINQLLDIQKIEAGNMNLKITKVELVSFVKDISDLFQNLSVEQGISLSLSSLSDKIEVFIDREKIEKVIFNLLSNAYKYNKAGGSIAIKTEFVMPQNEYVQIIVEDSGVGISSKSLPYIFEPFYQAVNTSATIEDSSGIGLSLCKGIIELHHGKIEVESTLDKGSVFKVLLPVSSSQLTMDDGEWPMDNGELKIDNGQLTINNEMYIKDSSQLSTLNYQLSTISPQVIILVVDDNADMRTFIKNELQNNYTIIEAANGKEGLQCATAHMPDLVLCDVMMPEMNGFEFCTTIKSNDETSHIPVILLTALSDEEYQISGFVKGADDYISKPFSVNVLNAKIVNIIQTRKKLRDLYSRQITLEPENIEITSTDEIFLKKAVSVIEQHISNSEFDVDILASGLNMGRSTLYRKFEKIMDVSVNDFINITKLKIAARYLKTTNLTVSEIAFQCGYDNTNFSKYFRKQFNCTPIEYRKNSNLSNANTEQ